MWTIAPESASRLIVTDRHSGSHFFYKGYSSLNHNSTLLSLSERKQLSQKQNENTQLNTNECTKNESARIERVCVDGRSVQGSENTHHHCMVHLARLATCFHILSATPQLRMIQHHLETSINKRIVFVPFTFLGKRLFC